MIRLGVCTEPKYAAVLASLGFEYIEIGLAWLHSLTDEEYAAQLALIKDAPIAAEAANGMMPGTVKVVGPEADEEKIKAYLEKAFSRAREMGVKTVVFGSGAARGVPEGWPHEKAWRQIAAFLKIASDYGRKYGIDLAIEPLRRGECNILNLVTEATLMSSLLNLDNVGALGDTYHMISTHEPYSALAQAGKRLRHVHVSHTLGVDQGRIWPAPDDGEDYVSLFKALKAAGYEGRVSIEAGCNDVTEDGKKAFAVLDAARGSV